MRIYDYSKELRELLKRLDISFDQFDAADIDSIFLVDKNDSTEFHAKDEILDSFDVDLREALC